MPAEGGDLTRITTAAGKHAAVVSPDDRWIADVYSYTNKPPELYVQENRPHADAKKLTNSPSPQFAQFDWKDVPIVTFKARDGVEVPGAPLQARQLPQGRTGRRLRPRRGLPAERRSRSGPATTASTCSATS